MLKRFSSEGVSSVFFLIYMFEIWLWILLDAFLATQPCQI